MVEPTLTTETPETLRANARECFRIARSTTDATIHMELLWLAQFYINRATEMELGFRLDVTGEPLPQPKTG